LQTLKSVVSIEGFFDLKITNNSPTVYRQTEILQGKIFLPQTCQAGQSRNQISTYTLVSYFKSGHPDEIRAKKIS